MASYGWPANGDEEFFECAERGHARRSRSSKFAAAVVVAEVRFAELDDVLSQLNILQTVVFSVITKHTQCF